jgi:hypothetical protein
MSRSFERHGFRYRVANPGDDQAIAALLNDNAIPGWIALSYRTQPGWHRPLCRSIASATIIGTRIADGKPGGIATRSVHPSYRGGCNADVGWLGQLRIDPEFRNRPHVLKSGFDAVRTFLHDPAETPWYLASIISGNETARRILQAGLDGFPRFEPLFEYRTFAFSTGASRPRPSNVRAAHAGEIDRIVEFINAHNRMRDFAPRLADATEFDGSGWAGLAAADFLVHETDGKLDGVAAIWDQRPYRSIVAVGYVRPLAVLRPIANFLSAVSGLPLLPAPGQALRQVYLSLAAVAGDEPEIWRELLDAALIKARGRGADLLCCGFASGDPIGGYLARRLPHRQYDSTIYRVFWQDDAKLLAAGDANSPKVEIGLL